MAEVNIFGKIKSVGTWVGIVRNLGWLAMAVAGVVYVVARVAGSGSAIPAVVTYTVIGLLSFGTGILVGTLTMQRRMSKTAEYSWESAEYVYRFDPDDILKHQQTVRVRIKANKHNVEMFKNRYTWTGSGNVPPPRVVSNGHSLMTEISRNGFWKYYYVVLERPLRKGATTDIEILQELHDTGRTFQSMLAKNIIEPIGELKLRVIFPPVMRPIEARAVELTRPRGGGTEWEIADECPLAVDATTGEAVYDVGKPKSGARYQIIWDSSSYPR
ncbi:hypothetical protein [Actinoplanes sp. CA-252034]|uniref:hypothetical protein n=1 Tax=Actinoplanes sp. CA-252034 TaxID=3239906 RepID=UPI003D988E38